jgi:hypothetical protein
MYVSLDRSQRDHMMVDVGFNPRTRLDHQLGRDW